MKRLAAMAAVFLMSAAASTAWPQVEAPATASTPQPQVEAPATPSTPQVSAPDAADVATANRYIRQAWNDYSHCHRAAACDAYFESFGVAISFGDGSFVPFSHVQRLTATSHDCIKSAMAYLHQGDKSLAVQWAMASRIENTRARDWLGNHPEAVLEALRRCCW
jgi:hypothetical protein